MTLLPRPTNFFAISMPMPPAPPVMRMVRPEVRTSDQLDGVVVADGQDTPREGHAGVGRTVRALAGLPAADDVFVGRVDDDEGRLELTGVDVEFQPADEAPWSISAAKASATKDIAWLELTGDVEIRSAGTDDSEPVTVVTQKLTFWPDTSNAESDERVEVQVGRWRFSGGGLRADLKGDSLRLESDVHGEFFPR